MLQTPASQSESKTQAAQPPSGAGPGPQIGAQTRLAQPSPAGQSELVLQPPQVLVRKLQPGASAGHCWGVSHCTQVPKLQYGVAAFLQSLSIWQLPHPTPATHTVPSPASRHCALLEQMTQAPLDESQKGVGLFAKQAPASLVQGGRQTPFSEKPPVLQ
jgi:hypothetical protein